MNLTKSILIPSLFAFLAAPLFAQEEKPLEELETIELPKATAIIDQREEMVEKYLNSLTSLKARFVQRGPMGHITEGVFNLEKPGKARFEYEGDQPFLIVSDGETLNLIDYEVGQVTKWPVMDTPLAMLLGEKISFGDNLVLQSAGAGNLANIIEVTAHDPAKPEQGTLTVYFSIIEGESGPNLTIRAWQVIDAKGDLTSITLTEIQENPLLEASLWEFEDPRSDRYTRRRRR